MLTVLLLLQAATPAPAPAPTAAPPPVATAAPVSAAPRSLADVGKGRKLEKEGTSRFSASGSTAPRTARVAGAPTPKPGGSANDDERDRWHERAVKLREDLARARLELDTADKANTVNGGSMRDYNLRMQLRDQALTPYRVKVAQLEADLAALPEECRRAGCVPGWIR